MNIVLITLDGANLGLLKEQKGLNKETFFDGITFSNVFTYAPFTISSMHSFFTGCYGYRTGVTNYYSAGLFRKDEFYTLPILLQFNNYYTVGDTINELIVPKGGFDKLLYHNEDKDDLSTRHKYLIEETVNEAKKQNKKFFLYLHYSTIHADLKNNVLTKYDNNDLKLVKDQKKNKKKYVRSLYDASIYLDYILGFLEPYEKDTLIIIHSDHGVNLGEKVGEKAYGVYCYDVTAKTFIHFKQPLFFGNKENKDLCFVGRSVDLLPTIIDLLCLKIPKDLQEFNGSSLKTFLQKDYVSDDRVAVIVSGNPQKDFNPPYRLNTFCLRSKEYKLIYNAYNDTFEVYNMVLDPYENKNIYNNLTRNEFLKIFKNLEDKI